MAVGGHYASNRADRPGQSSDPFWHKDLPAEIEDLTEAVNSAIARLNNELENEKRRAAEAAHALRTPVAVLVARLDSLKDDPALVPFRADIKPLSRTVTQFLLSSGADRLDISDDTQVDLNPIAEEAVARLTPFAMLNGAEIIFEPNPTPCRVHGSAEGIDLAQTNLIENAVFHGGPGPIEIKVGPDLELSVRDSGPGLENPLNTEMFDPFWRGAGAPKGGAGLGLAIVSRIQRAHGGRVEASNHPDGGAVFRPIYKAPD